MKVVFIIPYFGRFNNYFQLFLNSLSTSKICDFMIITDDDSYFNYPSNVILKKMSFLEFKKKIQSKFDYKITLDKPYKLCDFKPTYGYVLEEEILEYDYWGYCDTDIIFGDIDKFLTVLLKENFDKIFELGHCSLIKNTYDNNRLFFKNVKGKNFFKESSTTEVITIFDEAYKESINNIFMHYNKKIFLYSLGADIYIFKNKFYIVNLDHKSYNFVVESYNSIFRKDNLSLYSYINKNGVFKNKEYLYIHLQQRNMIINEKKLLEKEYYIVPDKFIYTQKNNDNIRKLLNYSGFNFHVIKLRGRILKARIIKLFKRKVSI